MTVLVIAPHPDDEVLGCGGVIRRFANEGHDVHVAIVTRGWAPLFPEDQVAQVRAEAEAASKILGVHELHFMDLPVTELAHLPEHELNGAMGRLIDQTQPNWVFLPYRSDLHEDHKQIFDAAQVALRPLPNRLNVERIMCYETLSETHWHAPQAEPAFTPHTYIDITSTLKSKIEAMQAYKSQLRDAPNARSIESIESLAKFRGMTVHRMAAEAFVSIREVLGE
ncbi:MAG: PIG-L domain-containing protein [Phycisphaerae bacterium]|nr:MAG: PIG-L domain-containing protein [Phycisphaerae bacterium]